LKTGYHQENSDQSGLLSWNTFTLYNFYLILPLHLSPFNYKQASNLRCMCVFVDFEIWCELIF